MPSGPASPSAPPSGGSAGSGWRLPSATPLGDYAGSTFGEGWPFRVFEVAVAPSDLLDP